MCTKLAALCEQKEVIGLKLETYREIAGIECGGNSMCDNASMIQKKCREFTQRIVSYEVNELLLRRRCTILDEEFKAEADRRARAEFALNELEATLRSRILYLELWKRGASVRVERLQAELDESLPASHSPESRHFLLIQIP